MAERRELRVAGDRFELGGRPFRLLGGAIHYPRVPRQYWRDRLAKLVDFGANAVETYAFWNAHEPYPGQFRFDGNLDVAAFVELAGSMGLHVVFRPGPYVCAEWDMGGLPWWLINDPGMAVRCANGPFLSAVGRYWAELLPRVAPLQSTRGGPIVAVQIENEYGYFGNDQVYLATLRDLLVAQGIDVLPFTSDGTWSRLTVEAGGLPGVLRTANFGSKAAERLAPLRAVQPAGPAVCAEFWVGWFDEWRSGKHAARPADDCARELDALLSLGASAVVYMFHGGTNFGFTAGGNLGDEFKPFVTSYDYDALLTEAGDVTPKFTACRDVVHRHLGLDRPKRNFPPGPKAAYGPVRLTESASLDVALPSIATEVRSAVPLAMERLGHGHGFVRYRTTVSALYRGQRLVLRGMHDWCLVRLDGRPVATWYRRDPHPPMVLEFDGPSATLEVLVHNLARSNFGHRTTEPKGLTEGAFVGAARHDERALLGWTCHAFPLLEAPADLPFTAAGDPPAGPAFHRGTLDVFGTPADTFLSLPGLYLGCAFVNGFNVGRYWSVGPQQTLYVPAPMLRRGLNEIVVFEAVGCDGRPVVEFRDRPELDRRG